MWEGVAGFFFARNTPLHSSVGSGPSPNRRGVSEPRRQSAEDKAIEAFGLGGDQRKRLLVMEGE